MPKLVAFTVPTGEAVFLNADAVLQVHEVFRSDGWAVGASTVIIYGDGLKVGVREELQQVLHALNP
jgi:hypothetical protein